MSRRFERRPSVLLGDFLREERRKRQWSLKELGEKLRSSRGGKAVSPQYLNDIEMDRRIPSEELLAQLAVVFDKEVSLLRALCEKGSLEVDEYLSRHPEASSVIGRLFRKAKEHGFADADWESIEAMINKKRRKASGQE
jgi:transcriptional regulator with XRE-family HTH domain